ncbi:MAG: peptidylprolyl isomerase, partial [Alphaproteobacteria bacterium]
MPFRRLPILLLTAALLASIALAATPERAWAQQTVSRIVASVNDDAITDYDLNARALLIALTSNTPPTPENRQRLARQALQN